MYNELQSTSVLVLRKYLRLVNILEGVVIKTRSDTNNLFVVIHFCIGNNDWFVRRNGAISCPTIIKLGSSATVGKEELSFATLRKSYHIFSASTNENN